MLSDYKLVNVVVYDLERANNECANYDGMRGPIVGETEEYVLICTVDSVITLRKCDFQKCCPVMPPANHLGMLQYIKLLKQCFDSALGNLILSEQNQTLMNYDNMIIATQYDFCSMVYNSIRDHLEGVLELLSRYLLETRKVMVIQKYWRRCIADPAYAVCRKRLMREANELCF